MKKIVFLAIALFLLGNTSSAQDFRFGFQASPSFSWMSTNVNKIEGNGSNLGLKLGMLGEYYFSDNDRYALLIGLGLAFNQGGTLKHERAGSYWPNSELSADTISTASTMFPGVNLKYSMQYIELPFALKLNTSEFGRMRGFAEIPRFTFGVLTQARGDIEDTNIEKENIKKDVIFLNVAWGLGGGIEYEVSENTKIIAGIFYQNGFSDVTKDKNTMVIKDDGEIIEEDSKGKLNDLTIRIGVMF